MTTAVQDILHQIEQLADEDREILQRTLANMAETVGTETQRNGPWTEAKNARRCALIDKEISGILTAAEAVELKQLQREMLDHRRRVAPLPLDDARKLHQELLTKVQQADPNSRQ